MRLRKKDIELRCRSCLVDEQRSEGRNEQGFAKAVSLVLVGLLFWRHPQRLRPGKTSALLRHRQPPLR